MLLNSVFLKSIRDQRRSLQWWSLGISLYCSSVTLLFEMMKDSIEEIAGAYPKDFGKVFGIEDISQMATASGWLNGEMYSMVLPICFIIFAIFCGANSIALEEEKRTIEILLSEPVSRTKLFFEKYLAFLFNVFFIACVIWLSVSICSSLIDMDLAVSRIFAATLNLTLLSGSLGVLSFTIAAATGKRSKSLIIPVILALISYITDIAHNFVDELASINQLSIFQYYDTAGAFNYGVNLATTLGFSIMIVCLTIFGYVKFTKRDLQI